MKKSLIFLYFIVFCNSMYSQNLFHSDSFYGGVTCAGFSTGQGAGTNTIYTYIEPGSFIRKAYVFTYTLGSKLPDTIMINNSQIIYDTVNQVMNVEHPYTSNTNVKLYYKDITQFIQNNFTNQFQISIFNENGLPPGWGTWTTTIYIEYEHPSLPKINTAIWVNDKKYIGNESYYFSNVSPFDLTNPVGFSLISDRSCSVITDGTIVNINNSTNDTIWGNDQSSINDCNGIKGHFYYQNNTLFGLDDDTPDNNMYHSDALANIAPLMINSSSFNLNLKHTNLDGPLANRNINLLFITAYTSPCDTFSITTSFTDTTICRGTTLNMSVTGGDSYLWKPNYGLSCDDCPNPIISADSSTVYTLTVTTNGNCKKTTPIVVGVHQLPEITSIATTPDTCGYNTGTITAQAQGVSPLNYALNGSTPQTDSIFNALANGNYNLMIVDGNGCTASQTAVVENINITQAQFTATPNIGTAPTEVEFINQSTDATNAIWYILSDTFYTQNANYTFTDTGLYNMMLVAYNNTLNCSDTAFGEVQIVPPLYINIPNVITPNYDQINDVFSIDIEGAKGISCSIFNRWGNQILSFEQPMSPYLQTLNIWDAITTDNTIYSDGTYFYVIYVITPTGIKKSYTGTVQVFGE